MPLLCKPATDCANAPPEADLWTKWSLDGTLEIHSQIPDGIKVGMGKHGRTLIATKFFPKGTVIYRTYSALVRMGRSAMDSADVSKPVSKAGSSLSGPSKHTIVSLSSEDDDSASLTGTSTSTESGENEATNYEFYLYRADGTLSEAFPCSDVHSVQDVLDPTDNIRQVYGL